MPSAAVPVRKWLFPFCLLTAVGVFTPVVCLAQVDLDPDAPTSYFDVMPVHSSSQAVRKLLDEIDAECTKVNGTCNPGVALLQTLFGGSYRDELPDFVVQLVGEESERLRARQPVLLFDRRNTPYLLGVQHITVLVFSERPVPMAARLTTIQEQQVNPFSGLLGVVGFSTVEPTSEAETEEAKAGLRWRRLSEDGDPQPLFLGSARLAIRSDIVARLTLIPEEISQVAFQSITAHLSNSRSTSTAFAASLAATFDTEDTQLAEENSDPAFNGYVLAKFYLPGRRPLLEVKPGRDSLYRRSVAVVFGTNVTNEAFSEIVVGLSFGHLIGKAGVLLATNWVEGADGDREAKVMAGIDFTF